MKAKQFIQDHTRNCSNELCAVEDKYGKKVISYHEWLTPEQALCAVEIEREEMVEKVEEYLYKQLNDGYMECGDMDRLIEDFKRYMNEGG